MADEVEQWSAAAGLGGLRTLVINRYVAAKAAFQVIGPSTDPSVLAYFRRRFEEFLKEGGKVADQELRRSVLLMVTADQRSHGLSSDKDAAKLVHVVKEVYNAIA
ncbi:hypothetical protein [Lentzea sp. CA-135723]|uniref:hypothetical protein n=1 Tax=Lentzea sp. CA-135723 TaxID=3239950 RepID=UPI003D904D3F